MSFYNINYKRIAVVLLSGIILISLNACKDNKKENYPQNTIKQDSQTNITENEQNNQTNITENAQDSQVVEEIITNQEDVISDQEVTDNNQTDDILEETLNTEYTYEDQIVINTFSALKNDVNESLTNDDEETAKDKAKGVFITIVDFIFFESEINGIKFDDLTDAAKQSVLDSVTQIDELIMTKFPNYKEEISETTSNAFNKASELIKKGANKLSDFTQEQLGEENYQSIIDAKDDLVYYTKNALGILGDFTSDLWNSGKEYIKNWYENFKN